MDMRREGEGMDMARAVMAEAVAEVRNGAEAEAEAEVRNGAKRFGEWVRWPRGFLEIVQRRTAAEYQAKTPKREKER